MENIYLNPIAKRVQDGTVSAHVNLCATCRNAVIRTNALTAHRETLCTAVPGFTPPLVRGPVAQCNRFIEVGKLNLYEMGELAWHIEVRGGKYIGFLSPEELQKRKQDQEGTTASPVPGFGS